jgi:hypothetical protein
MTAGAPTMPALTAESPMYEGAYYGDGRPTGRGRRVPDSRSSSNMSIMKNSSTLAAADGLPGGGQCDEKDGGSSPGYS